MKKLTKLVEDIIDNLTERKNYKEEQDIIAIYLVLNHTNKNEEFLQYLKEHPEQDFDEVLQVALAYGIEKTKEI